MEKEFRMYYQKEEFQLISKTSLILKENLEKEGNQIQPYHTIFLKKKFRFLHL